MGVANSINIDNYNYELPRERIAEYPVSRRDSSQLLVMDGRAIRSDHFYNIHNYLPQGGLMVFNNTRVIRARLMFRKDTGARVEVFCLEPVEPTAEINHAFEAGAPVVWKCLIGNAKKWRSGQLTLDLGERAGNMYAERTGERDGAFLVQFSWDSDGLSFAEVIEKAGRVPLPPYIDREAEEDDKERYQTIYARHDGSVAAPTAGLHFTDEVLGKLAKRDTAFGNVVLHVGAGTFKPVSADDIRQHDMHTEQIIIHRELLEAILKNKGHLTAVGTTSMRTLESLYWYGELLENDSRAVFSIPQWQPYAEKGHVISTEKALNNILDRMNSDNVNHISGDTSLIIVPGYEFRIADILVTNFHMPKSTLLLLVAAFVGDRWKGAYAYAMNNDFRFLSYGDSCLFFRRDYRE